VSSVPAGISGLMPRVSIVIPNWNQSELLAATLRSLRDQAYRDFETVVVDNGSTDDSRAMLARDFPEVRLIALPGNVGFARATNLGLQASPSELLACLNNDVECEPGWLGALVAALDRQPSMGSVASLMLDAKRPGFIDAAGDAMSLVAWNMGRGEPDGPRWREAREILSACAGAAIYRRTVFELIGWFDESFFAWFEDVDLGIRAQLAGFRCWYEPAAVVRHWGSATAATMSDRKVFLTVRNGLMLFFKTMPLRRVLLWGPLVLAWPWADSFMTGRPFAVTVKAWFAFWGQLPAVLRGRREVYARRTVPVSRLTSLLENPLNDVGRAFAAIGRRLRGSRRPLSPA
jgi:GT2 family glycosyltransferase